MHSSVGAPPPDTQTWWGNFLSALFLDEILPHTVHITAVLKSFLISPNCSFSMLLATARECCVLCTP